MLNILQPVCINVSQVFAAYTLSCCWAHLINTDLVQFLITGRVADVDVNVITLSFPSLSSSPHSPRSLGAFVRHLCRLRDWFSLDRYIYTCLAGLRDAVAQVRRWDLDESDLLSILLSVIFHFTELKLISSHTKEWKLNWKRKETVISR